MPRTRKRDSAFDMMDEKRWFNRSMLEKHKGRHFYSGTGGDGQEKILSQMGLASYSHARNLVPSPLPRLFFVTISSSLLSNFRHPDKGQRKIDCSSIFVPSISTILLIIGREFIMVHLFSLLRMHECITCSRKTSRVT